MKKPQLVFSSNFSFHLSACSQTSQCSEDFAHDHAGYSAETVDQSARRKIEEAASEAGTSHQKTYSSQGTFSLKHVFLSFFQNKVLWEHQTDVSFRFLLCIFLCKIMRHGRTASPWSIIQPTLKPTTIHLPAILPNINLTLFLFPQKNRRNQTNHTKIPCDLDPKPIPKPSAKPAFSSTILHRSPVSCGPEAQFPGQLGHRWDHYAHGDVQRCVGDGNHQQLTTFFARTNLPSSRETWLKKNGKRERERAAKTLRLFVLFWERNVLLLLLFWLFSLWFLFHSHCFLGWRVGRNISDEALRWHRGSLPPGFSFCLWESKELRWSSPGFGLVSPFVLVFVLVDSTAEPLRQTQRVLHGNCRPRRSICKNLKEKN